MARSSSLSLARAAALLGPILFGLILLTGALPARAQTASLELSPAVALWNDDVEVRIQGTGCSGRTADPQYLLVGGRVRIHISLLDCTQGSTQPFSAVVHLGPMFPGEFEVGVYNPNLVVDPVPPLATAQLTVHRKANLDIELPAVATDAAPFTIVLTGPVSSSCFFLQEPTVHGNVIESHFDPNCPFEPPGGPHIFREPFELGPLPAGEYEVRVFAPSFYLSPALARRTLVVHDADLCVPSGSVLCLQNGRFKVEAAWTDFAGNQGVGHPVPLAEEDGSSGLLWFFQPDNVELTVKVLNGCGPADEGAWWVFLSSGSTVSYMVTVTDMRTGAKRMYTNAPGVQAPLVADTSAFACNPP